ncbi:MAG: fatty acid desaturase [Gammaproteobacteria bacterium]|nr:MAG: fatty acid desaturase [Gammaproteobacteria bacterium]
MSGLLRYEDALWPNLSAFAYVATGYVGGFYLLSSASWLANGLGVILLAHAMVIAAYLVHECAHNSLFRKNRYHRWLGEILLWICGASYSHYEDVRHKHVRHHTDRADVVSFDYRPKLEHYPSLLKVIQRLEWFYIPAWEVVMHALVIILPFVKAERKHRRPRIILMLVLRTIFFVYLASVSLTILLLYPLSYMLFLTVMRFMDVHQHTYEIFETLDLPRSAEAKKFDRQFEQKNTYSNLLSVKHPWLNLLVLNFPYHNAHHEQPGRPWHQLPKLHRELYGDDDKQILSFGELLKSYHRYRVQRVLNADAIDLPVKQDAANFIGVDGVSFLTTH